MLLETDEKTRDDTWKVTRVFKHHSGVHVLNNAQPFGAEQCIKWKWASKPFTQNSLAKHTLRMLSMSFEALLCASIHWLLAYIPQSMSALEKSKMKTTKNQLEKLFLQQKTDVNV